MNKIKDSPVSGKIPTFFLMNPSLIVTSVKTESARKTIVKFFIFYVSI